VLYLLDPLAQEELDDELISVVSGCEYGDMPVAGLAFLKKFMSERALKKRFHLYLNGDYFHGAFSTIEEAEAEAKQIEASMLISQVKELGKLEWSARDREEQETIILL